VSCYLNWDSDFETFANLDHADLKFNWHFLHTKHQLYLRDILKFKHIPLVLSGISLSHPTQIEKNENRAEGKSVSKPKVLGTTNSFEEVTH